MSKEQVYSIVLFDGVCNFCNGSVNFIINHDSQNRFKFATLQSKAAQNLLREHGIDSDEIDSIVLIENNKAFTHSTAALRIVRNLDGAWRVFGAFLFVPSFVRDFFYKIFARYRYNLFGKTEICMAPTPELLTRFLN
jgi:predicted DCC family thiol-disulfide oxidoreductase YuxK